MSTTRWGAVALAASGFCGSILLIWRAPLLALAAAPALLSLLQISLTPALRSFGLFRYHSPMLKVTLRNGRSYELHGGTAIDFLQRFRWRDRGRRAARDVMRCYLDGLLDVCAEIRSGAIGPDVEITGTTYFFGERTAARLGMRFGPPSLRLRATLLLHWFELTLLYSFTRGRWSVPNIWSVRKATIRAGDLLARTKAIEDLRALIGREGIETRAPARHRSPERRVEASASRLRAAFKSSAQTSLEGGA